MLCICPDSFWNDSRSGTGVATTHKYFLPPKYLSFLIGWTPEVENGSPFGGFNRLTLDDDFE
jgi:hypothetical protein